MSSKPPPIETEIKIHWSGSADEANRRIEESGYRLVESRTLESDQLFDLAENVLWASGRLLRLRHLLPDGADEASSKSSPRSTVTYKGPGMSARYKSREEIEFDVSDPAAFAQVLDRLGYVPKFSYQKYRTKFGSADESGVITIDETPIGVFLELEGPEYWIDATAKRLGFDASAYSTASYSSLYREYRTQNPGSPVNMIFENKPGLSPEGKRP